MFLLLLSLVFNSVQCAQLSVPRAVLEGIVHDVLATEMYALKIERKENLQYLQVVSVSEFEELWCNYKTKKRGSASAQTKYESMRDFAQRCLNELQYAELDPSEALAKENRIVLFCHVFRTMIRDKRYDFMSWENDSKKRAQALSLPYNLACYNFSATSDYGSGSKDFFQQVHAMESDSVSLFSLDYMKRLFLVTKRPTVEDRALELRVCDQMLMYVDCAIDRVDSLIESLEEQMVLPPCRLSHSVAPSLEDMILALNAFETPDCKHYKLLSAAYFLLLSFPYDSPNVPIQEKWFVDFWKDVYANKETAVLVKLVQMSKVKHSELRNAFHFCKTMHYVERDQPTHPMFALGNKVFC
ncbi:MAG: hypothetical protein OXC30_02925 [Alphaproteobacteria bacterium]|nr:hypothetical protein [Alphaproteobacteria bacterium]